MEKMLNRLAGRTSERRAGRVTRSEGARRSSRRSLGIAAFVVAAILWDIPLLPVSRSEVGAGGRRLGSPTGATLVVEVYSNSSSAPNSASSTFLRRPSETASATPPPTTVEQQQPAEARPLRFCFGRLAQRDGRVAERLGGLLEVLLQLLVVEDLLRRALAVAQARGRRRARTRRPGRCSGAAPRPRSTRWTYGLFLRGHGRRPGLGRLLLRCHRSPLTRVKFRGLGPSIPRISRSSSAASNTSPISLDPHELEVRRAAPRGCPRGRPRCARGASTRLMPARCAASAFSFRPPIGSTWPVSVISPVIAMSSRTGRPGDERHQRGRHRDARRSARPWGSRPPARGCGCRGSRSSRSGSASARARARRTARPAPTPSSRRRAGR